MATEIVRAADRADTYALRYNEANKYQLTANCCSHPFSRFISKNRPIPVVCTLVERILHAIDMISGEREVK